MCIRDRFLVNQGKNNRPIIWQQNRGKSTASKCNDPGTRDCYYCYGNSCLFGTKPSQGYAYMRVGRNGDFKYVCNTNPDKNAEVLCKQLGYPVYETNGGSSPQIGKVSKS